MDTRNNAGATALMVASQVGYADVVHVLLAAGEQNRGAESPLK